MSGLCKRLMHSSLIISLISLSCGPDTPVPGPVDVKATGTYRVHRKDGTPVFERKIDDLCETRGNFLNIGGEPDYTVLSVGLACFDSYNQREDFLKSNDLYAFKYTRPYMPFEGGFFFPNGSILDVYLNVDRMKDEIVRSEVSYDNNAFASSCGDDSGRLNMPVSYSFKRKESQDCGEGCVFKFDVLPNDSKCYDVSAEIEFYVSGIKYE